MKKVIILSAVALSLSSCMGGTMRGVMSDKQSVVMNYDQGMSNDTYSITIDGEYFEGKAIMVDASTTFGTAFGQAFNAYGSAYANANSFAFSTTGKFKAVLIGSRGSSLKCLMNYADSSGFTSSGGVGECAHSDGRQINLVW